MSEKLLQVKDLSVVFRQSGYETLAVDRVSFDIGPGETVALVGESGSGKSVTALSVLKLLPSSASHPSGSIRFKGKELPHAPEREIRRVRGNDITIIFQEPMTSLIRCTRSKKQIREILLLHRGRPGPPRARASWSCSVRSGFPIRHRGSAAIRTSSQAASASA